MVLAEKIQNSSTLIRPTEATIDLAALATNLRVIKGEVGVPIIAVLKADAYALGAAVIARFIEGLGVWGIGVATVEEGVELRNSGVRVPVLVMGAAFGCDHEVVISYDLTPVVGNIGDIRAFAQAAANQKKLRFGLHLKIDTGMSRLGVLSSEFEAILHEITKHKSLEVEGLCTHFFDAEAETRDSTLEQIKVFDACVERAHHLGVVPRLKHAANTAAALRFPRSRYDAVRIGIGLYGALPSCHVVDPGLKLVVSWSTQINAIRLLEAGTSVSYGGTYRCKNASTIATIPVGYADGYPRSMGNFAEAIVNGKRVPVVGRVCMDLTMLDVTALDNVKIGDSVTLLGEAPSGESISIDEYASWAQTIPYEVLTRITKRVPRIYPGIQSTEAHQVGVERMDWQERNERKQG